MTALPWLPVTANSTIQPLEDDLKARGWKVWWTRQNTIRLFAPDGATLEIHAATTAQTMRDAYASAQEYANAQPLFVEEAGPASRLSTLDQMIEDRR